MKVWLQKEVFDRSGIISSRVISYGRRRKMTTVDFPAIYKLARALNVTIEDLVEILEK
ncbi:helix-turn-helix domain-containing protein [Nostoc sp. ChiQUE01b]|uniref:helix-turn-helix domain-containing protein n=1 Tax=Nostoc sp. ChiQUE01b TaxID=3075376 RepID=UPI002AD52571|nr:helix-turn-helix domain-containing protein [Nostoc sp. ChiQUE01b]MDZ8257169.1 helix-turn-helix domain-containing protein [Nostoc sp. ChiQUE01b]